MRKTLVFVLALLMMSSCLSFNLKALMAEMNFNDEQRKLLAAEGSNSVHPGTNDVNNHHYIPRQDFGNYNGGGNSGGGTDDNGDKWGKNN